MAISDAHKNANRKWDKQNMLTIGVRLRRDEAMAFKEYAARQGRTANAVLKDFVMACISPEQENTETNSDSSPESEE